MQQIPVISMISAGAVLRDVALLRNVKRKSGSISMGLLFRQLVNWGMMETEARHKEYFVEFEKKLREIYPDMLAIGAGCCTKCKVCTYPNAPCRFPKQAFSSMEAYGMLVTQVCQANELQYYYGDCTIAYTSCYLLE